MALPFLSVFIKMTLLFDFTSIFVTYPLTIIFPIKKSIYQLLITIYCYKLTFLKVAAALNYKILNNWTSMNVQEWTLSFLVSAECSMSESKCAWWLLSKFHHLVISTDRHIIPPGRKCVSKRALVSWPPPLLHRKK